MASFSFPSLKRNFSPYWLRFNSPVLWGFLGPYITFKTPLKNGQCYFPVNLFPKELARGITHEVKEMCSIAVRLCYLLLWLFLAFLDFLSLSHRLSGRVITNSNTKRLWPVTSFVLTLQWHRTTPLKGKKHWGSNRWVGGKVSNGAGPRA